jgi:RNA polymerase sigma-70 factor (ECF subfamily)
MSKAFDILMEQFRPMLLSYATTLCHGRREDAEDIVQETCLTACEQLPKFREGHNFGSWLRGIARNKALEHFRAGRQGHVVTDSRVLDGIEDVYASLDGPSKDEESWHDRIRRWLRDCVESLAGPFQAAVRRVYSQQMSLQQAADAEGVSFAAMAQRLSRSREQLRRCVRSKMESEP